MRSFRGTIRVFTFKEGVLSAVAHDLRIRLERFSILLDGESVRADFDLTSLHVDGPMENGVFRADQYDAEKRADVDKAMHGEVLKTHRNPTASFEGTAKPNGNLHVSGNLTLNGKTTPITFDVKNDGTAYRAAIDLTPTQWGIAPYKALLGAIRLKDRVRIELELTDTSQSN